MISPPPSIPRRSILAASVAGASAALLPSVPAWSAGQNPFTLGVASGDPTPDGAVLWTRLAPAPFQPDGGMAAKLVEVTWRVFGSMRRDRGHGIVAEGIHEARPEWAHSVHVELSGLAPRSEYYYEFQVGRHRTRLGRFRTAPAPGAALSQLSFAFVSCQSWRAGYYTSYRDLIDADHDLIVHLGDYIYEIPYHFGARTQPAPEITWPKPTDLAGFRYRHALHKTDPDLQAAHERAPFVVTWDDHEVENDWAGNYRGNGGSGPGWEAVKAAAFRAFYEHMPLRRPPVGASLDLYRRFHFGDLATFHVLDTRQYRDQATTCAGELRDGGYCASAWDENRSILGVQQERWLHQGLTSSPARWNVIANSVGFAPFVTRLPGGGPDFVRGGTNWTGYAADLQALQSLFGSGAVRNPVVITGDQHVNRIFDVPRRADDLSSRVVATEFIGTSITSAGTQPAPVEEFDDPDNPQSRWFTNERGYVAVNLSRQSFLAEFRAATDVDRPDGPVVHRRTWAVEDGSPGAKLASGSEVE